MPFFTVILPTFNRAAMAREAIRSVLWQTFEDFELRVVDDGSTDDTPALEAEFASDKRVVWTRAPKNQGQHRCRNLALRAAQGRYVTFLDSDDWYLPERLEAFKRLIEERPAAGFFFSNAYVLREGRVTGRLFDPARPIPQGRVPGWYAVGEEHLPYVTTNLVIRRQAFEQVGYYREDMKILEDTELYARMLGSGLEVASSPECLAVRRLHEGQITRDYEVDYRESLEAFRAGGASEEQAQAYGRRLAAELAVYFLKDLQPARAREFFDRAGRRPAAYWATYVPVPLLAAAKKLRRLLEKRPVAEYRQVEALLARLAV
jgi:glycosyltransferase involved in cell wall biosynthesis